MNFWSSTIKQTSGKVGFVAAVENGISVGQTRNCGGRVAWTRSRKSDATSSDVSLALPSLSTTTVVIFRKPCFPASRIVIYL